MVDIRQTVLGGIWANEAPDPPATPIAETTYRDSGLTEEEIEEAWAFATLVDSAKFNEFLRRASVIINYLEKYGITPWSPYTNYEVGSWCLGSNGTPYYAILTSGPGYVDGPRNPVSQGTYWKGYIQDHTNDTAAHNATSAATANRIIRRDNNGRAQVVSPNSSNDIAIKATVDAEASSRITGDAVEAAARVAHQNDTTAHGSSYSAVANSIVRRNSAGQIAIENATVSAQAMTLGQLPQELIGLTTGGVGSLAFLARNTVGSSISIGGSYNGSGLRYAGIAAPITTGAGDYTYVSLSPTAPSGTWRALGYCASISGKYPATLFIRLS